jgi:hypothetical protein
MSCQFENVNNANIESQMSEKTPFFPRNLLAAAAHTLKKVSVSYLHHRSNLLSTPPFKSQNLNSNLHMTNRIFSSFLQMVRKLKKKASSPAKAKASPAPLTPEEIENAINEALELGLEGMMPATLLVVSHPPADLDISLKRQLVFSLHQEAQCQV